MNVPRINLAETSDFDLGGLRVSPSRRRVYKADEYRELEPKVVQVLIALASARPAVVSRDKLVEQCWDGRIVGDDALNRCILALRHLAKEYSPEPFAIETVPRVGYSLVEQHVAGRSAGRARPTGQKLAIAGSLIAIAAAAVVFIAPRFATVGAAPASIAVVPFRNLSAGDAYFAEGIGEEIRGQLSREPQFRVAGGNSSGQFGSGSNIQDIARQLNVDYVLEGSVQTQDNRVRVNAGLVRARDGTRLWSDSYETNLNDIFAIQREISAAIAGSLRRKLVRTVATSGPLVTNAQAYVLYLTAKGQLKSGNDPAGRNPVSLLRDSLKSDPGYAPAWVSLANAIQDDSVLSGPEAFIAARHRARIYALHALELAPNLAEAHRELGFILPYGSPESKAHLSRAAALDPNDAENLHARGLVESANGEFGRELESYRLANEIDPLWFRSTGQLSIALAEMGDRRQAEAVARRGFAENPMNLHIILGRIARILGDHSEAARHWAIVARGKSARWSDTAQYRLDETKYLLGLSRQPVATLARPPDRRRRWYSWIDSAPTPAVWRSRNREPLAADQYREDNQVAAKLMLNTGRVKELADTYNSPVGLLSLHPAKALRVDQLSEVPVVAIALRRAGRAAEADNLLRQAENLIRAAYRRTAVPFWFDAEVAAIYATEGKDDEALSLLEHALARGWSHFGDSDLREIADEPAFRSLHGHSRFDAVRAKLTALYARERAETVSLHI